MKNDTKSKTIFAIGGGKGGVGKSIFSIALGTVLADKGNTVILVDLDLGASNLHTYVGITKKTPTIADFILRKVSSLEDVIVETSHNNLRLISGAEFLPGMANPAHWMKLKIMRHIKALPADVIIIDLGAGVHFNTLDFFSMANRGIIITAAEPGAVMNAYGFIKGALFRKLQNVFRHHATIGSIIEAESKKTDDETEFTIHWLSEQIKSHAPDMVPIIQEIGRDFNPALVANKIPEGSTPVLIKNLLDLCIDKTGVSLEHVGNIPDIPEITNHLLNIPGFLTAKAGVIYANAVRQIVSRVALPIEHDEVDISVKQVYSDKEVEEIIQFIDVLDDTVFGGSQRDVWKLRMYFKPADVVNFLISQGVRHEAFYHE
jgi:flagellar biosynthesis protein FlhG